MIQTLIIILTMLVNKGDILTVTELNELHTLDSTHHYYGVNLTFEDGSYTHVTYRGDTITGCIPFRLCSWVGIDTPWEDFLNAEDSAYMYKIVDMYKHSPEKFKLFSNQYH